MAKDVMRKPKGARTFDQPKPARDHRRLTPLVEESIRARIAENGFSPTIKLLMSEIDCLRGELAALKAEQ